MANQYISAMSALWNSAGTTYSAIKMNVTNAASAAGSMLFQLQVAASDMFSVDKNGNVTAVGAVTAAGLTTSAPSLPSTNDGAALGSAAAAWSDLYLAIGGVINWSAGDVTFTHADNAMAFAGAANGYTFDATILPVTADVAAIGDVTKGWSDLFLASGATINFSDEVPAVIAHTAATPAIPAVPGWLTVTSGDFRVTTAGSDNTSVVTVAGSQNLTNKTLTGAAMNGTVGATTPATGAFTTLTTSGSITATGAIVSTFGTVTALTSFISSSTTAQLATNGAGTINLRPNGVASTTGQLAVDSSGNTSTSGSLSVTGTVTASSNITATGGSFIGATASAILGNASDAGQVLLRPNGTASSTGQWALSSGGNVVQSGTTYHIDSASSCAVVLDKGASGDSMYIQSRKAAAPRWLIYMGDSVTETTVNNAGSGFSIYSYNDAGTTSTRHMYMLRSDNATYFDGAVTSSGTVTSSSNFHSTSTTCILSAASGGQIVFRPNGPGSAVEQMHLNTNGTLFLAPSAGAAISAAGPTNNAGYTIIGYGRINYAGVLGYCADTTFYGMLGYYVPGVNAYSFFGNGAAVNTQAWSVSDSRVKSEIKACNCADAHSKVRALRVRSYRKQGAIERKDLAYDEMGWLAQDIEKIIPEAVHDVPLPQDTKQREQIGGDTMKATNDRTLLAHLWAAFQHQADIIEKLEAKVAALEGAH